MLTSLQNSLLTLAAVSILSLLLVVGFLTLPLWLLVCRDIPEHDLLLE